MDTATTEIYTLSLHDALPVLDAGRDARQLWAPRPAEGEERNREEAADADHDRHRPRHAARAAIRRLAQNVRDAVRRHVVLDDLLRRLSFLQQDRKSGV